MITEIHHSEDGKDYDQFGQELVDCRLCTGKTPMRGTRLCDRCWELDSRVRADPEIAMYILTELGYLDTN
jgi:hypothetical protein